MALVLSLYFAIFALLFKDISYLNDRFILRGISQGLCLIVGAISILMTAKSVSWRKYWILFCYLGAISVSVLFSEDPLYSGFQVLSLTAVLLFFIAFNETSGKDDDRSRLLTNMLIWAGAAVCMGSLLLVAVRPDLSYATQFDGTLRFRGVFSQPAMIGTFAGLLFGVAAFGKGRWFTKLIVGILSMACVLLTYSRGSWAALLGSTVVISWWTSKKGLLKLIAAIGYLLVLVALGSSAMQMYISEKTVSKTVRAKSLATFGGRLSMWRQSFDVFLERPLTGYGFGTGEDALTRIPLSDFSETRTHHETKRRSLHNGYIQALIDSGLFGFMFYIGLLSKAWLNLWRSHRKQNVVPLYMVTFVAIANMAESIMFAAATAHNLLGWFCVIFGLSLSFERARDSTIHQELAQTDCS